MNLFNSKSDSIVHFSEPSLTFGFDQDLIDPRDGLTLFGPYKSEGVFGVSWGAVGTKEGIEFLKSWVNKINSPINETEDSNLWIPFPGFEAAFGVPFPKSPVVKRIINSDTLMEILKNQDSFQRVHNVVDFYAQEILDFYKKGDPSVKVWFVVSPEQVFKTCRPQSKPLDSESNISSKLYRQRKDRARLQRFGQSVLFEDQLQDYEAYEFDADFRRQLKARLILEKIRDPIQIVRETTLSPDSFRNQNGYLIRDLQPDSQVAWNLSSTVFYKIGGKPWKLHGVRKGVCYLGMVYKKTDDDPASKSACCAAQMFLDSGDGVVFSGAVGPWKSPDGEDYHLSTDAAREIIRKAILSYAELCEGRKPDEIFVHGRTYFNDEEWKGFSDTGDGGIKVVGVRIRTGALKLFGTGKYPILRGSALIESPKKGYIWTMGYIPRLKSSPFGGVPYPLSVEIVQGESEIGVVLKDILALTKLNYNACQFADGMPITLNFADKIGDILTSAPIEKDSAPLPFKFYI